MAIKIDNNDQDFLDKFEEETEKKNKKSKKLRSKEKRLTLALKKFDFAFDEDNKFQQYILEMYQKDLISLKEALQMLRVKYPNKFKVKQKPVLDL